MKKTEKAPKLGNDSVYEFSEHINAPALATLLLRKGVISLAEFRWLIVNGYAVPKLKQMNDGNWQEIKEDLVAFLTLSVKADAEEKKQADAAAEEKKHSH